MEVEMLRMEKGGTVYGRIGAIGVVWRCCFLFNVFLWKGCFMNNVCMPSPLDDEFSEFNDDAKEEVEKKDTSKTDQVNPLDNSPVAGVSNELPDTPSGDEFHDDKNESVSKNVVQKKAKIAPATPKARASGEAVAEGGMTTPPFVANDTPPDGTDRTELSSNSDKDFAVKPVSKNVVQKKAIPAKVKSLEPISKENGRKTIILLNDIKISPELDVRLKDETGAEHLRKERAQTINQSNLPVEPIIVAQSDDPEIHYNLADGSTRYLHHKMRGDVYVEVIMVRISNRKEFLKLAVKKNVSHGMPLSPKERRHSAELLKQNGATTAEIAESLGVDERSVRRYMQDSQKILQEERENILNNPNASPDEIAQKLNVGKRRGQQLCKQKRNFGQLSEISPADENTPEQALSGYRLDSDSLPDGAIDSFESIDLGKAASSHGDLITAAESILNEITAILLMPEINNHPTVKSLYTKAMESCESAARILSEKSNV
jgi:DNA-binding NarL/FixJ family response regulator